MKGSGCRFASLLTKVPLGINGIPVSLAHSPVGGVGSAHGREHPEGLLLQEAHPAKGWKEG